MTVTPFAFEPNPESLETIADIMFTFQAGTGDVLWGRLDESSKNFWRRKATRILTAYMAAEHAAGRGKVTKTHIGPKTMSVITEVSHWPSNCPILILRLPEETTP
jgi:hypothetical protein